MTDQKWSMETFIHISLVKSQQCKMTFLEWSQNFICHTSQKWCLKASSCYQNLNQSCHSPSLRSEPQFSDIIFVLVHEHITCNSETKSLFMQNIIRKKTKPTKPNKNIIKHLDMLSSEQGPWCSRLSFLQSLCSTFAWFMPVNKKIHEVKKRLCLNL